MSANIYNVNFRDPKLPEKIALFPNQEWITAAIKVLREQGVRAISIKNVCAELNRSESEFNKVFKDFENFTIAVLDYWYEKETLTYIEAMDDVVGSAEQTILAMIEVVHNADRRDEIAIRNWALTCPSAQNALARVDNTRLDFGTGLFKEMGFTEKESIMRIKIHYTSQIGTEYTSVSSSLEQKLATCKLLMQRN
ncbi:MAG: TetR/AcrR family transcriptional regulator [Emcibacteraceae bacterium]|nr:TetR/AcrR family transcriptional regulator [Emcibacteraceae bacterium]